jgi:CheY-like chemotaxis protein
MNRELFLDALRTALNHLYDPDYLRRSPLAALFAIADRLDTPAALQKILTSAIESLRPSPAAPTNPQDQRLYDILLFRYVQQSTQEEVAHQLAISPRQLRREQTAAIEMLACVLSDRQRREDLPDRGAAPAAEAHPVDDLAWLKDQPLEAATDLALTLAGVLDLLRPLAAERGIAFDLRLADGLPGLAVHRMALRQMLLSLLDAAIQSAIGPVVLQAAAAGGQVVIEVGHPLAGGAGLSAGNSALDMAGRLADLSGGRLSRAAGVASRAATLVLPAAQSVTVLAIDDNADLLRLLERYVEGTRYRLITTREPLAAFGLVEREAARVIVMDVMMPDVDGWEMLGRLRAHPRTAGIPIVICTILDQERLALSLGSSGFLRKPVMREALLAALDAAVR